jgi:uncharacterized ion transporter superfamily protein YfcC
MLTKASAFLARYKGLPTMVAILLVVLNFGMHFLNWGWISDSNLFLHLGIIVGFLGLLLAKAVG